MPSWRKKVFDRDGHMCAICGSRHNLTIHHKVPSSRGGESSLSNGITWCERCHERYNRLYGLAISDDYGYPLEKFPLQTLIVNAKLRGVFALIINNIERTFGRARKRKKKKSRR